MRGCQAWYGRRFFYRGVLAPITAHVFLMSPPRERRAGACSHRSVDGTAHACFETSTGAPPCGSITCCRHCAQDLCRTLGGCSLLSTLLRQSAPALPFSLHLWRWREGVRRRRRSPSPRAGVGRSHRRSGGRRAALRRPMPMAPGLPLACPPRTPPTLPRLCGVSSIDRGPMVR